MIFRIMIPMFLALSVAAAESSAVAVLVPTTGNTLSGTVVFTPIPGGLHVHAQVRGLTPGSVHGFHIHEYGDLRSSDGTSAGGHFNPGSHHHGSPSAAEHHAGDLGNLTANPTGEADLDIDVPGLSVLDGQQSIAGRAVVIHIKDDDLTSQPVGNAGARIAVGIIGVAAPSTK